MPSLWSQVKNILMSPLRQQQQQQQTVVGNISLHSFLPVCEGVITGV